MKSHPRAPIPQSTEKKAAAHALPPSNASVIRRHLYFGWWTPLIFLTVGLALEALHAFKVGAYLKVSHETRRLMWTLATRTERCLGWLISASPQRCVLSRHGPSPAGVSLRHRCSPRPY